MNSSRSSLLPQIQQLLEEMRASQAAFANSHAKANALFDQISLESETPEASEGAVEESQFELDLKFGRQPEQKLSAESRTDHYVEQPFLDPYDCFDDSAPEGSFPYPSRLRKTGALEGLFESNPRSVGSSDQGTDVEIEYLPDGGYRMRSMPAKKRHQHGSEGIASEALDGLTS